MKYMKGNIKGMKLRDNRPLNNVPPAEIVTLAIRDGALFVFARKLGLTTEVRYCCVPSK